MEKGIVKFFNSSKRFGFIIVDGGGEIFFHFNDGEIIQAGRNSVVFSGEKLMAEPAKGISIVFERNFGHKGPKAAPWGFAKDYERAKNEIANRPAPAVYRVMKQTTVCGNPPSKPETLWEGSDITKLSAKYPRTSDRRTDDLNPSFSCGDFDHYVWFERQTEKGWESTQDPRPVEIGRRRR